MLRVLLAKDLRRARRNPMPWVINLILPLALTGLIGLAFGGSSDSGGMGVIHFAVVDEDNSPLTKFLRGAANQNQSGKYLAPVFMERTNAMREINANKISAVFIIPTNFTHDYLLGTEKVSLELIKNPAESIHPAVLEEGLGALVTSMNAVSRNFQSEFPAWNNVFQDKGDYHEIAGLIDYTGDRLKAAKKFIDPPLVSYTKETSDDETNKAASASSGTAKSKSDDGIFAYLLIGLSGMFLLFLAANAMSDLYRELRHRTLERFQTLRNSLVSFLASKAIFTVVILMLCSAILLGGGGLIFHIHWEQPIALVTLTLGYACFAASFYAVLVALMPDERRAAVLGNLAGMGLSLMGGCLFPPQQLPAFLRENITLHLPSYWFVDTMRDLQYGGTNVTWGVTVLKLGMTSAVMLVLAAILFRRKFRTGLRA